MRTVPNCDISWLRDALPRRTLDGAVHYNPRDMMQELEALAALRAHAAETASPADAQRACWLEIDDVPDTFVKAAEELAAVPGWVMDQAVEHLMDMADQRGIELSEHDIDAFFSAVAACGSNGGNVATDLILGLPEAAAEAASLSALWRSRFAHEVCSRAVTPVVLHIGVTPPVESTFAKEGSLSTWVWIAPDSNNIEPSAPDIFVINASLVYEADGADGESNEIVAALRALLIPTVFPDRLNAGGALFEVMDAHSQLLNDVWKTTVSDVLDRFGTRDIGTLAEQFGVESGGSICVPWIVVKESWRGSALGALLLAAVVEALRDTDKRVLPVGSSEPSVQLAGSAPSDCSDEGRATRTTEDDEYDGDFEDFEDELRANVTGDDWLAEVIVDNPVVLVVLPIEGTRPTGPHTSTPGLRGTLLKENPRRSVDAAAEHRRKSLTRYFMRMNVAGSPYHVHSYDPWDYPVT